MRGNSAGLPNGLAAEPAPLASLRAGLVLAANRRKELPGKPTTKQVSTS